MHLECYFQQESLYYYVVGRERRGIWILSFFAGMEDDKELYVMLNRKVKYACERLPAWGDTSSLRFTLHSRITICSPKIMGNIQLSFGVPKNRTSWKGLSEHHRQIKHQTIQCAHRLLMYNKDSSRIEKHHYRWFALGPMRFKDF